MWITYATVARWDHDFEPMKLHRKRTQKPALKASSSPQHLTRPHVSNQSLSLQASPPVQSPAFITPQTFATPVLQNQLPVNVYNAPTFLTPLLGSPSGASPSGLPQAMMPISPPAMSFMPQVFSRAQMPN
jgi:hypothetical protein